MASTPAAGGHSPHLLERDSELGLLGDLVRRTADKDGGLLLIDAPAGVGKSALLGELRAQALAAGLRVLAAHGTELGRSVPFGVARRLTDPLVRADPALLDAGLAGVARPIFHGDRVDVEGASLPLVQGLVTLLRNAAAGPPGGSPGAPLLLVVDDLQWVDEASLLFLTELSMRVDEIPAGLAIGLRAGEPTADPAVLALVQRELADADSAFAGLVARATAGKPLLVAELIATARARGSWSGSGVGTGEMLDALVPDSVARSALMRLEPLGDAARRLAEAAGALALAERAHAELLAAGARPRRAAQSGPEALTPSERRVAELAAHGMTTRDIAQRLVVSPRTVDAHLSKVFRKLRVGSRREIAVALDDA